MESIAAQFAVYYMVLMVENLQASGRPDGKIQESQKRNAILSGLVPRYFPGVPIYDFVRIGTEWDELPEVITTGGFEDGADEMFGIARFWGKTYEIDGSDKMLAFWIGPRGFGQVLGYGKLSLKTQNMARDASDDCSLLWPFDNVFGLATGRLVASELRSGFGGSRRPRGNSASSSRNGALPEIFLGTKKMPIVIR